MGRRREPRKEIEVPVRIFGTDSGGHAFSAQATTVNVSQQGIELRGVEPLLKVDEIIGVTYGKNRVHFRVKWIGQPGTPKAGHIGLLNTSPEKPLWDFPLPSPVHDSHQPKLPQQRKHPRIKCNNSVELHIPDGSSLWARIADLGLGGCFVEMASPPQTGTRVNVSLWIGEAKVWADCEVAYSTPGFGIGLKFLRIAESDRERIRQFLEPLAKRQAYGPALPTKAPSTDEQT